ncbi:MAG: hypothetical protein JNN25_12780 [Candidatus Kapabacteria bacterium]|nr:hypothetical protein [Candidatus Kapabacteria bacterium]
MIILLATDDKRLQNKAERLFAGHNSTTIRLVTTADEVLQQCARLPSESEKKTEYIFIDLDAKEFNAYELAREIKERAAEVLIVAASLGIDPSIIQKTKLYRIDRVLQRYKFEELLKNIATGMPGDEVNSAN